MIAFSQRSTPFKHLLASHFLTNNELKVLEHEIAEIEWVIDSEVFYEIWVPANDKCKINIASLINQSSNLAALNQSLERAYGVELQPNVTVKLQKYAHSNSIGFHTDANANEIRSILNISKTWSEGESGHWVLSDKAYASENVVFYPTVNNLVISFLTDSKSFHSLTEVGAGESIGVIIIHSLKN